MNASFSAATSFRRLLRAALALSLLLPFIGSPGMFAQTTGTTQTTPAPVAPVTTPTTQTTQTTRPGADQRNTTLNQTNPQNQNTANPQYQFQPRPETPEPPTEFQELVSVSAGKILPIFGASLFSGVPSTFAPVLDVPVGSNYTIGPGDELTIQVSGQVNQLYNLLVDRSGDINVPDVGVVHVAGIPFSQLNAYLQRNFGRLYRNFTLSTNLGSLRTIQVFVVGEARRPGSYSISSLSTLLNAVFASGGPLPDGSLRDIQVKRDGKTLVHFDLYDLLLHGDKTNDIPLLPGDVIFIPFAGPQVAIAGSVRTPAIYELKGPTSIADALQLAGGETAVAGDGDVRLERVFEHTMRSVEDVNLSTQGTQILQNGDIVSVNPIVDRFRNAVTLRGNVANPGRYVWHDGMRISDLIPNKAALITRDYWTRQNELGMFLHDYQPETPTPVQRTEGALGVQSTQQNVEGTTQANAANAANPANGANQQTTPAPMISQAQNQAGSQAQQPAVATSRTNGGAEAGGNAVATALTANNSMFTAKNDVVLSAPDIDWSYAVVQRLNPETLKTSLVPFNLGRLVLDGDSSQNLELQPNDVVTIFSTADIRVPTTQQTRYVRLEGEFVAPGVYSVLPGETLRALLRRAGGFTPEAYLYASAFTRDSVRRVEEQRLQEYADQLEAQISSVTATNTARALSSSDQAAATASEAEARASVARLRRVVPNGRIVLDLKPNSEGIDAVPDLALEDGDRFVVPRVPSSITVEGQVYNANAFVYAPRTRMMDYLRRAGGPDREADRRREFILRADGSVVSEQYNDVKKAPVFPGDTLVVPPVIDRRATFQRVIDVASILTGLGYNATLLYLVAHP